MSRMVYYDQQGNEVDPPEAESVPVTNYDLLISKTPEELACWISEILMYCTSMIQSKTMECSKNCPLYKCCNDQPTDNIECWLKSLVEVDND